MFSRLDAPKTIDSMFGCSQTHSRASRGGIAPDAKTDIATARNWRVSMGVAVGVEPARHPEAELVDVRADDRVLDAGELERVERAAAGSS